MSATWVETGIIWASNGPLNVLMLVHRMNTRTNEVSVLVAESNESHGVTQDSKGRLISAQAWDGSTRIGVIHPPGSEAVLADSFEGRPFSRPNDAIVARNGGVYFTDPGLTVQQAEALVKRSGKPLGPRLPPAVYYIPPGGRAIKIEDKMIRPNGIQLSPDERTLYVNDTRGEYLIAMDVQPNGTLGPKRNFAKYEGVQREAQGVASGADGLAVDTEGRVYAATTVGVQVFSAQGQHLGTIPLSRAPQNLAFAGRDKKTLYIVGRNAAWKVQMLSTGYKGRAK